MDYFNDLLKSYSMLKQRKLKLLIENTDPELIAKQELQKAQSFNPPPTTASPYITNGVRGRVAIFQTAKKGWSFAPVAADGKPNIGAIKSVDQYFNVLVGFFAEDAQEGQASSSKFEKTPAGGNIANSEFAEANPDEAMELAEVFQNIALNAQSVRSALDKSLIKGKNWESPAMFETYVFGSSPQAIESQILGIKIKILKDANNEYQTIQTPPDNNTLKGVAKNIDKLFQLIAQDNINEDAKMWIQGSFAVGTDGTVSVFTDIEDSGLVFKDTSGFLKMLLLGVKKKFTAKIRKIDIKKQVNSGLDNNIRGVALEEILPILQLQRTVNFLSKQNKKSKSLEKLIADSYKFIKDKMDKLKQNYESWVAIHENSALDPEEVEIINSVGALVGNGGESLIKAITSVSKEALALRKPDFIITKGRETGEGRRQDTFEVYTDFAKAKSALLRMGYSDEEITTKGLIKQSTAEEAFGEKKEYLKASIQAGLLQPGQPVYYTPISLKNYMELDKAVFGTTTSTSNSDFIEGNSKDPQNLFFNKYIGITGNTPDSFKELHQKTVEYNKELRDIWDKVGKVPTAVKARSSKGNLVNSKPFQEFIENTMDIINKNSTFEELNDHSSEDNPKSKITLMIRKYLEEGEDDGLEDKIKAYVAQYTKNAKLISDVAKGDTTAKNYLLMKLFNTGGSVDDGLICDYRGLQTNENYSFLQNDVIRDVITSIQSNDGRWLVKAKNNTFIFYDVTNPKMRVSLIDKVEKRLSQDGGAKYSTKSSVEVTRDLLKFFNKKRATKESIIDAWMENQKILMNEILNLKEVGIIQV